MPIIWKPQMSIANDLIDLDHNYLFCLINTVELVLRTSENIDEIALILDQLADYAETHFAREEQIQIKSQYPGYIEHKQMHQALVENLTTIRAKILRSIPATRIENLDRTALINLLRHWLLDHVLSIDLKLGKFLRRARIPLTFS